MPDPIASAFKPGWRLQLAPATGRELALVQVMLVQEAWRRLTARSQLALLAVAEGAPGSEMHHSIRACLIRRGLIDEDNQLTAAGRAVVRHRPLKRRPIVDVPLPPLPAEVSA